MKKITFVLILFAVLFIWFLRCTPNSHEHEHKLHLPEKIKEHQTPVDYDFPETEITDTASFLKVHSDLPEVADFFTEKRAINLTSYPCSNCHNKPIKQMQLERDPALRKAHWNVHLAHAGENTMNCKTCHAGNDTDKLTTLTGKVIHFDESFKLCGQCHSTQLRDWKGGAHGKELTGWKPPRVAKTCVSCHNPHKPSFPSRFPARLNTKQLGGE